MTNVMDEYKVLIMYATFHFYNMEITKGIRFSGLIFDSRLPITDSTSKKLGIHLNKLHWNV